MKNADLKVLCLWFNEGLPETLNMVRLAEHCLRLSPQICFRQTEALFIEYGKCQTLYSEQEFFRILQEEILFELELNPALGTGSSIPEALLRARYTQAIQYLPLTALLDLADPFARDPFLQKSVLRIIADFQDLGVRTLSQFRQIPLADLTNRFGALGILCAKRAAGEMPVPWPFWKPEEVIRERTEFPYFEFYGELEPILFALKTQLDRIFGRLLGRGLQAQKMEVKIICETNSLHLEGTRYFEFDFMFAQAQTKGALNIIQERLTREFQRRPIQTPIEAMEICILETAQAHSGQKNLIDKREEIAEQLNALLGRLSEIHGRKNIFFAELTEDRRPEKSWRRKEIFSLDEASQKQKIPVTIEGRIPRRPTYLIRPEKIQVSDKYVCIRHRKIAIRTWLENDERVGERINGAWVEKDENDYFENAYHRDYYNLELENNVVIYIFQTPNQDFFLHGFYG